MTDTLDEIALRIGADKSSQYHDYARVYEQLFASRRDAPVRLLELGWGFEALPGGAGASARMWEEFFTHPEARFSFIDIEAHQAPGGRVLLWQGDQADGRLADAVAQEMGPWDFIVDDASHVSSKTIAAFLAHFPHLRSGGVYVVEDIHSSYHAHYYGVNEANPNPRRDGRTAMGFFKALADQVNRDFFPAKYHHPFVVEEVRFVRDQVIVVKA